MNIHTRFVFENRFHEERAAGELTAARLSELMLAAQKETHLDALAADGWYPDFWISKLHFYISVCRSTTSRTRLDTCCLPDCLAWRGMATPASPTVSGGSWWPPVAKKPRVRSPRHSGTTCGNRTSGTRAWM